MPDPTVTTSFNLTWTPAGGLNSTGQQVQVRINTSPNWDTLDTLSATANSYIVPELFFNTIYNFRIVTMCTYGGPVTGNNIQSINMTCPTVVVTPSYDSVSFSFSQLGGSVTEYQADLLNGGDSSVITSKTIPTISSITDGFTGLDALTNYQLMITPKAGTFTKQCPPIAFSTTAIPTCSNPTGVTVMFSEGG